MARFRNLLLCFMLLVSPAATYAADVNCKGTTNVEEFRYSWRIRGAIRFIAGLMFPTSGVGNFKTTYPNGSGDKVINSELLITPTNGEQGFYAYESQMDPSGQQTLMTYSGYAWGNKTRKIRAVFDYVKRLARIHKETPKGIENTIKPMPAGNQNLRDVLTAIYYLRQNAGSITGPITTTIYTDGQEYPVVFKPGDRRTFTMGGQTVAARAFEIADAPGGKKWPGGVKVYLSNDSRRIPFRIEIAESFASLQLDLQSVESCGFLQASK